MKRIVIAALLAGAASTTLAQDRADGVVVTATRFPEKRLDAPVGMTVITAQDIARDTAHTLPDLLARLGGLQVRNNSGSPDQQIDLRGFGITGDQNTLVLLDGIRLNEIDLSSTRLSSIPLQSIERIEILRGSGSVLYGGGASGGTINIVTRGPELQRRQLDVYGGAGSYGTFDVRGSANIGGERAGLLLSGSHYESDNYRQNNRVRQDNVSGDLRLSGADSTLAVKFGSDTQRLQLPGARNENQLINDPRGATTPRDWSTRSGNFVTFQGTRQLTDVELAADLGYRDQFSTANFVSMFSYNEIRSHSLSFSPRVRWNLSPFGMRSSLVAGVDWIEWDYGRRIAGSPAAISNPFSRTKADQGHNAIYMQYNTRLSEATKATLGWRRHRVEEELVQSGFLNSAQRQTRSPRAGELGLEHALSSAWTVFGKVGTSFRIATVDEHGFTTTGNMLEPQTARHKEVGIEYRHSGTRLRANVYEMNLNNEIYFSPLAFAPNAFAPGANTNLSPTRRQGLELSASRRVSPQVEVSGDVILQSAKFKTGVYGGVDVSGRDVPLVPRALATLRASWRMSEQTRLSGAVHYVGRQRYDNDQANTFNRLMPAYTLADLKLSHALRDWTLSATVNNLFDKKYYNYGIVNAFGCATPVCAYPQAGRTFLVSAEHSFK